MYHFQLSGKGLALLNETLQVLGMKKVHLMTFYPTCMTYLPTACLQAAHVQLTICDVMTSADLKRSSFMSPKSMIIMHVLADVRELCLKKFLRLLDGDNGLIIECHQVCANLTKF